MQGVLKEMGRRREGEDDGILNVIARGTAAFFSMLAWLLFLLLLSLFSSLLQSCLLHCWGHISAK